MSFKTLVSVMAALLVATIAGSLAIASPSRDVMRKQDGVRRHHGQGQSQMPVMLLRSFNLPAGGSVMRGIETAGYSDADVRIRAKGIRPGEVVNVGFRYGMEGRAGVNHYAIQRAMGTTWPIGNAELNESVRILGPKAYLSFENRTGHAVTITTAQVMLKGMRSVERRGWMKADRLSGQEPASPPAARATGPNIR